VVLNHASADTGAAAAKSLSGALTLPLPVNPAADVSGSGPGSPSVAPE
jgi:hypothetical protein